MSQSLAPYLIIFDASGQPVASSVTLHGQTPTPLQGVLENAKGAPMNVLTWMPEPGVRTAIVVVDYANGYALAGRSLRAIEQREDSLTQQIGAAAPATRVLTIVAIFAMQWLASRLRASAG
jgi:hypothetical protein